MIEALLAIMSSSGVGAITGGIFGWLNRREDRKTRKRDQEFQLRKLNLESKLEVVTKEADAFVESQKTLSKVGGAIKSAVRPLITGYLMFMVHNILMKLEGVTGGISSLPPELAVQLYREITLSIISLTAMAVSWWFASRPSSIQTDL